MNRIELLKLKPETLKNINLNDIDVRTYRSKPYNKFVNPSDSSVELTHKPTGISVASESHRAQILNKNQALIELNEILESEKDIK